MNFENLLTTFVSATNGEKLLFDFRDTDRFRKQYVEKITKFELGYPKKKRRSLETRKTFSTLQSPYIQHIHKARVTLSQNLVRLVRL